MIERLISGGQNGADLAGLLAAKSLGIPTGGTTPRGWRVCEADGTEGSNPSLRELGLRQHESRDYQPRTIQNVEDSGGTLWVGFPKSPGGRLTIATCVRKGKPCIINPSPAELRNWVKANGIKVLNVAGNRASSSNPGIYERTYSLIVEAFTLAEVETK